MFKSLYYFKHNKKNKNFCSVELVDNSLLSDEIRVTEDGGCMIITVVCSDNSSSASLSFECTLGAEFNVIVRTHPLFNCWVNTVSGWL